MHVNLRTILISLAVIALILFLALILPGCLDKDPTVPVAETSTSTSTSTTVAPTTTTEKETTTTKARTKRTNVPDKKKELPFTG